MGYIAPFVGDIDDDDDDGDGGYGDEANAKLVEPSKCSGTAEWGNVEGTGLLWLFRCSCHEWFNAWCWTELD